MEARELKIKAVVFDIYNTMLEVGPPPADADEQWRRLLRENFVAAPSLTRLEFSVATSRVITRRHEAARAQGISFPEIWWPSVVAEVIPEVGRLGARQRDEFVFRQMQIGRSLRLQVGVVPVLKLLAGCRRAGVPPAARRIGQRQPIAVQLPPLEGLRPGGPRACVLGIASNAQAYTLRELTEALAGSGEDFRVFDRDLCFWSFAHGFSKPDPHVFQLLTARLEARGVAPGEILMVGDRLDNDIEPARRAGWQTWHLSAAAAGIGGGWPRFRDWIAPRLAVGG